MLALWCADAESGTAKSMIYAERRPTTVERRDSKLVIYT
jgi:hypothetical protein